MVLKKRIKIKPRDIDNKEKYYAAAALCPICGTNIREEEESRPLLLCDFTIPPKVLYVATRKKVTFFCPTCGCSWNVKQFNSDEGEQHFEETIWCGETGKYERFVQAQHPCPENVDYVYEPKTGTLFEVNTEDLL